MSDTYDTSELTLLVESLAITIHDHIKDLQADASMQSYRRWVWELLQNAIDLSLEDQECIIRFTATENHVEFQHNGRLFNHNSLTHLFFKKSSKRDKKKQERVIGNFGTGFLTTHLLSKIISLSGIYQKKDGMYTQFQDFLLNREGDFHQITNNILSYIENRNKLESSAVCNQYNPLLPTNTNFLYKTNHPLEIIAAKLGLEDLEICLPYSLIFISHLKQIKNLLIVINRSVVSIESESLTQEQQCIDNQQIGLQKPPLDVSQKIQQLTSFEFNFKTQVFNSLNLHSIKVINQNLIHNVTILETNDSSIQLCLNVKYKSSNKRPTFKILQRQNLEANWFAVFPLIGTELNSFDFIPTKERNGLILFGPDQERVDVNKTLILEVLKLSKRFVAQIVEDIKKKSSKWSNLHLLANIQLPDNKMEYIDIGWYSKEIVQNYKSFLFEQPLVLTDDGYKCLKGVKLPFSKSEQKTLIFVQLCRRIFKDDIPVEKVVIKWLTIFEKEEDLWPRNSVKFSLGDLAKHISERGFKNFRYDFKNNEEKGYTLLNDLIQIIEEDQPELLTDYPILPNQMENFLAPGQLFKDDSIPELYKEMMLQVTLKNWKDILLDTNIINVKTILLSKGIVDIEAELNIMFEEPAQQEQQILFCRAISYMNIINLKQPIDKVDEQKQFLSMLQIVYPEIIQKTEWDGDQYFQNQKLQKSITKFIIEYILVILDQAKNLKQLLSIFNNFADEISLNDWIFDFINLVDKNYNYLLKTNKSIFPNKHGSFIKYSQVIIDRQINPKLLAILIQFTKYNNDFLLHQFEFQPAFHEIREIDSYLILDKLNFEMLDNQNNHGILSEILKATSNYGLCLNQLFQVNLEDDQKELLFRPFVLKGIIDLIKCVVKAVVSNNKVILIATENQKILDAWILYSQIQPQDFLGDAIIEINEIHENQVSGINGLYKSVLVNIIIQLSAKENIASTHNDNIYQIINQILQVGSKLKLPKVIFEQYKIIPNQQGQFRAVGRLFKDDLIPELYKDMMLKITLTNYKDFLVDPKIINLEYIPNCLAIIDMESELTKFFRNPKAKQQDLFGHAITYLNILNTKQPTIKFQFQKHFLQSLQTIYPRVIQIMEWDGDRYFGDSSLQILIMGFIVEQVLEAIDQAKNLKQLFTSFNNFKNQFQLQDWIFKFINLVVQNHGHLLKTDRFLFPNHYGNFIKHSEVILDRNIDPTLMETLNHLTKYNNEHLLKHFKISTSQKEIKMIDTCLVEDKIKFDMPHLDNYGIFYIILEAIDNYNVCLKHTLQTKAKMEWGNILLMPCAFDSVIALIKLFDLTEVNKLSPSNIQLNQNILELWETYIKTSSQDFLLKKIIDINKIEHRKIQAINKLYELVLLNIIIKLDQKGIIVLDQDQKFLNIINQVVKISSKLSLSDSIFETYKLIPNQLNVFQAISEVKLDFDDITQTYGSSQQLKELYDQMVSMKINQQNEEQTKLDDMVSLINQKDKVINYVHSSRPKTKPVQFNSIFSILANKSIVYDKIRKFKTSEMLQYIDDIVQYDRIKIEKKQMVQLYKILDKLCQENSGYQLHLKYFNSIKSAIFSEFFQNKRDNEMTINLMSSGYLPEAYTLTKCLLEQGFQTNLISFNTFRDDIKQSLLDQGISTTQISKTEVFVIEKLSLRIFFIFSYCQTFNLSNDNMDLLQQYKGKKLDLVVIYLDKNKQNPIYDSKCFIDINSILNQKFGQNHFSTKNDYTFKSSEGINWNRYMGHLKEGMQQKIIEILQWI